MFDKITTEYEKRIFGAAWCGPELLTREDKLVARYEATGDGRPVEVYCQAWPATFYKIRVPAGVDYKGRPTCAYEVSTGSGIGKLVAEIALQISDGMLDFSPKDDPAS